MGKIAEPPKCIEDIDSPFHENLARIQLGVHISKQKDYAQIRGVLEAYGKISLDIPSHRIEGRYFILTCSQEMAKKLNDDYNSNASTPLSQVQKIREIEQTHEPWY